VAEGAPPADRDAPLAWSMEGAPAAAAPAALGTGAADPGLHSPSAVCLSQSHVGGPLKGGDPGVRLIAPGAGGPPLAPPPPPEGPGLRVIPLHDPFAAHPEDRASPLLAARAPAPVLRLHPDEAAALGETARVGDTRLPVVADPAMPRGHVGLPAALARRLGARAVVEGEA
jgi:NADH-quinone oxidoreductase subunit G